MLTERSNPIASCTPVTSEVRCAELHGAHRFLLVRPPVHGYGSVMQAFNRRAARLIVLDPLRRVFLLQYARASGETFWATPGGGLEEGESFEEAAIREAVEELGLTSARVTPLWEKTADFHVGERLLHQQEHFFLLPLTPEAPRADVSESHRREGILASRWWTLTELKNTTELVFPADLAGELERLLGSGVVTGDSGGKGSGSV